MHKIKAKPYLIILLGFVTLIMLGTILLLLPISTNSTPLTFIEAFFTSASAVCVTGLSIIEVGSRLSVFGKIVLAILIQIGGLGVVTTVTLFLVFVGTKLGINDRVIIRESLNQTSNSGLIRLLKSIIKITLIIEATIALIYTIIFLQYYPFFEALGIGVFHSISAFNNAGFDVFGYGNSLGNFANDYLLLTVTAIEIILGGLGFIVIKDILEKKFHYKKLTIYSKIVIKMTILLILIGTVIFWSTENIDFINAFFLSVTTRTAGFSPIAINTIKSSSVIIIIVLMFIGASPSSTGGGIKTTTIYNLFKSAISFATGKPNLVYGKKIADISIRKANLLFLISLGFYVTCLFIVLLIEALNGSLLTFEMLAFECMSALGTVGLSFGITPVLNTGSQIVLCLLMVFGRVGPLTVVSITNRATREQTGSIEYIEEKIIVG